MSASAAPLAPFPPSLAVREASASAFQVVQVWSAMQARHENALRRLDQEHDSRMEEQVEDLRDKMRLLRAFPA